MVVIRCFFAMDKSMKIHSILLAFGMSLALLAAPRAAAGDYVPETRYDWSQMARQITAGTQDKYGQAYAIYRWLCDNIAYDTSHTIYNADECYERQRGVCQAYCELFYHLAKPLGLEVDIVTGMAKDLSGNIDDMGHAWVFIHTDGNTGIVADPTWGAGSVNDGVFTRSDHDDTWFHVDPYWLIFTHFPDEKHEQYQLLPEPVDWDTFLRLPPYRPGFGNFGQQAKPLFEACVKGQQPEMPDYYPQYLSLFETLSIPTDGVLHVGRYYDFAVRRAHPHQLMLSNSPRYYFFTDTEKPDGWSAHDGWDSCRFMPTRPGDVSLAVREDGRWSVIVRYRVAEPTKAEIAAMEAACPQYSPVWDDVQNFFADRLQMHGADLSQVLSVVKSRKIKQMPIMTDKVNFTVKDIPWDGVLHAGETYTFSILPGEGEKWAVINEGDWYEEWTRDPVTRVWSITVTPQKRGVLLIGAKLNKKSPTYSGCIEYEVK